MFSYCVYIGYDHDKIVIMIKTVTFAERKTYKHDNNCNNSTY